MPLPKGINTPAVRAEWLAERRGKVEEFDRLVGKGIPECKVARALGTTRTGFKAMRQSVETLEDGGRAGRSCGAYIDLGLALLSVVRKPGEQLTHDDIAAWCGCTRSAIPRGNPDYDGEDASGAVLRLPRSHSFAGIAGFVLWSRTKVSFGFL